MVSFLEVPPWVSITGLTWAAHGLQKPTSLGLRLRCAQARDICRPCNWSHEGRGMRLGRIARWGLCSGACLREDLPSVMDPQGTGPGPSRHPFSVTSPNKGLTVLQSHKLHPSPLGPEVKWHHGRVCHPLNPQGRQPQLSGP